jgi:hypothetical protein
VCGLRYTTPTSELTPPPKCSTDCPGEEQRHEMTLPAADSTAAWAAGQRGVPTGLPRVAGLGGREDGLGWRHGDRAGTQLAHVGRRVRDGCTAWCLGRPRTRRATLWRPCARSTITATRPSRARRRRGEHGEYGVYGVGTREARIGAQGPALSPDGRSCVLGCTWAQGRRTHAVPCASANATMARRRGHERHSAAGDGDKEQTN